MTEKQAKAIREVLVQGGESLSDAVISTAPEACRRMKYDGSLIPNGTRIYWPEDKLIYKNGQVADSPSQLRLEQPVPQ